MKRPQESSSLDIRGLPRGPSGLGPLVKKAVEATLRHQGIGLYAVSVTFVDDRAMGDLNRRALGREGTTDVIAFDLAEEGLPYEAVGDVYVSIDRARAQSLAYGVSLKEEILRLAVHGLLHTIGYSDRTPPQRRKMESLVEQRLKEILGPRVRGKATGAR